jgi:hypothetical protein
VFDRGIFITAQAVRRQLAAMPHDLYLIRLIHSVTKRPFPGERLWTAQQLTSLPTLRFLRVRNLEGCDIYLHPYAADHNAGYILIDLDHADPTVARRMRANGHEPCVVVQTSPGHWQAWIRVSSTPLPPGLASAVGRRLAHLYGGDPASTDWRHLGRLAGFTNQKPQRRTASGLAPWVKVLQTAPVFASQAETLLYTASQTISQSRPTPSSIPGDSAPTLLSIARAQQIYCTWVRRWHIAQRFQPPDWSIVDLWVARALLAQGISPRYVPEVLQWGSPHFPRGHGNPADYLRRTMARARPAFPAPRGALCAPHAGTPTASAATTRSNSAGGR